MHNNSSTSNSSVLIAEPEQPALPVRQGPAVAGAMSAPLRVIGKAIALLAGVMVPLLLFVVAVPDGNDFALVTVDKHAALAKNVPEKIVFVGGSNLAFGLDSDMVEHELGGHVVNMGVSSFVGLRFMLEEIKPSLNPSDTVVLSLEYEIYYYPANGLGTQVFMLVKARPSSIGFLTDWGQRLAVAKAVPEAAQQKILRLIRQRLGQSHSPAIRFMNTIEVRSGLNGHGDLISHLGLNWPFEREEGIDLNSRASNKEIIEILKAFTVEMNARGVRVVLLHPPVPRSYYDRQKQSIENLQESLKHDTELQGLTPPENYVFPDSFFFDSIYHLNATGRKIRTGRLIKDLRPYFQEGGSPLVSHK